MARSATSRNGTRGFFRRVIDRNLWRSKAKDFSQLHFMSELLVKLAKDMAHSKDNFLWTWSLACARNSWRGPRSSSQTPCGPITLISRRSTTSHASAAWRNIEARQFRRSTPSDFLHCFYYFNDELEFSYFDDLECLYIPLIYDEVENKDVHVSISFFEHLLGVTQTLGRTVLKSNYNNDNLVHEKRSNYYTLALDEDDQNSCLLTFMHRDNIPLKRVNHEPITTLKATT